MVSAGMCYCCSACVHGLSFGHDVAYVRLKEGQKRRENENCCFPHLARRFDGTVEKELCSSSVLKYLNSSCVASC